MELLYFLRTFHYKIKYYLDIIRLICYINILMICKKLKQNNIYNIFIFYI